MFCSRQLLLEVSCREEDPYSLQQVELSLRLVLIFTEKVKSSLDLLNWINPQEHTYICNRKIEGYSMSVAAREN
jgi:hypothetical protein